MESTSRTKNPLHLNTTFVRNILVEFLRDETHNAGFTKAVIGVSGGVDSAVSLALTAEALGKKNVLALILPYRTSSPESRRDAELLIKRIGVRSELVDITSMVDPYIERLSAKEHLRRGNIMARQRMIVLYDYSALEKSLVIGTSNKTESLLGYGTLYGDMACALNPLGDLYKTQVWQLAEELNIPRTIIEKKPTADLWIGQTDEGELGFRYCEVDKLLYYMVDERRTENELLALGFKKKFIQKIRQKIRVNQFKRRLPLIAKVSHRTINVDFRYVRDWEI